MEKHTIIENAEYAASRLCRELDEAEFLYQKIFIFEKIISIFQKLTNIIKIISIILILFGISTTLIYLIILIIQNTSDLFKSLELLDNIKRFIDPIKLVETYFLVLFFGVFIIRLISYLLTMITPKAFTSGEIDKIKQKLQKEIAEGKSLLALLKQELNSVYYQKKYQQSTYEQITFD